MNIKNFLIGSTIGAALFGSIAVSVFAASIVANGSFESGTITEPFVTVGFGGTNISNWNVVSGSVDYISTYWPASEGLRSIDLSGNEAGAISQSLTTVVDQKYKVTFDMAGNPDGGPVVKTMDVDTGGTPTTFNFDTTGNTLQNMGWLPKEYTFKATSVNTPLTFKSTTETAFGPALDNVVVTAIEPVGKATGGLTLSGPKQQISFNAFDYGVSSSDTGHVEYQNFDYPGGLHYTADVLCARVVGTEAWFMFQIPEGKPLAGYYVVSYVKDGGSPGTKDKYGHAATLNVVDATSWCENGTAIVTNYTTTGGNAVVHK